MSFTTLKLQQDGEVLRITIANPPVNLLTFTMVGELFQIAGRLQVDPSVRVVVFDSADADFFIAHFDLNDVLASTDPANAGKNPDINGLQALALTWQILPQVKIAKVNGRCRGGGLEFLLALDMIFATDDSRFALPEASGGFVAAGGGATRTAMALGPARALEFLLSGRDFSGTECERYGLINRALPAAELDTYVESLVQRLALRTPSVVAMSREVLRRTYAPFVEPLFAGLAAENEGLRAGLASDEMQAGMAALLKIGQIREHELDLPATIASFLPFKK